MHPRRALLVLLALGLAGCLVDNPLICTADTTCVDPAQRLAIADVRCLPFEKVAHCALRDDTCPSKLRWHESAAAVLAGKCVDAPDSGTDFAIANSPPPLDLAQPADLLPRDSTAPDLPVPDLAMPDLADPPRDLAMPADLAPFTPPSCVGLMDACGPVKNSNCCETLVVAGGFFLRGDDQNASATVGPFRLDRYEVTVGRFRTFINAGPSNQKRPPANGAGEHPRNPGTGWNPMWNTNLPPDADALKNALLCHQTYQTFTDPPKGNETLPVNCVTWYEAFAFCVWDGGRLPTEAEWNFAAAGGAEQRRYPWSVAQNPNLIDGTYASYDCLGDGIGPGQCAFGDIITVGIRSPKGNGRWGHADLAGNFTEWILDYYNAQYVNPCMDCTDTRAAPSRVARGGSFRSSDAQVTSAYRSPTAPATRDFELGFRCVRTQ